METYIQLSNIHKSFSDGAQSTRAVLCGIDLTLAKGDFVSITGVSGSGKTTLLNILGTLMLPDRGEYLLDGTNVTQQGADLCKIRNRHVGFVFQDFRLLPQYNALENILLPLLATADNTTVQQQRYAEELMQTLGIAHLAKQYPSTFSGGEKARVAICRALINRPSLLLADEPTGQLDRQNAHTIATLLQTVNQQFGTTIIMVTHDADIAQVANRILTLNNGKLQ